MEIGKDTLETLAGNYIAHDVVTLPAAGDITQIVAANPRRRRVILVNTTAPVAVTGAGSAVVIGAKKDKEGNDLAVGNGFPLNGEGMVEYTPTATAYGGYLGANVVTLETKDAVYGVATGGTDATVAFIEETN